MVVAYVCAIVAAGIESVSAVIERMLFPPQFSGCVKDALLKPNHGNFPFKIQTWLKL